MNAQVTKLMKQLKVKDDAIQKAYSIIEAQQQQIQMLSQQSQSISCRSSYNRKVSRSLHEQNCSILIMDYKNELNKMIEYDTMIHTLFTNQVQEQYIIISNQKLQYLSDEIEYWQNQYTEVMKSLEKAININQMIEQQNLELQYTVGQVILENKISRQFIQQLVKSENNCDLKLELLDFLSSSSIQALNQSFQTFSSFISEVVLAGSAKIKQIKDQETYQIMDFKNEIKQLTQYQFQNELFIQELSKVLDLETYQLTQQQICLNLVKEVKKIKFKTITNNDCNKENDQNRNNIQQYSSRLSNLCNQYNQLIKSIIDKLNNNEVLSEMVMHLNNTISLLFNDLLERGGNLKLMNALNSIYRQLRNVSIVME